MKRIVGVILLLGLLVSCAPMPYVGGRESKIKQPKTTNVKMNNQVQVNKQNQKRKTEVRNDLKSNLQKGEQKNIIQAKNELESKVENKVSTSRKVPQRVKQVRQ